MQSPTNCMAITGIQNASNNEYMLSYDYCPPNYTLSTIDNATYLCNIFDVDDYIEEYDSINKVMLYLRSSGLCNYEIKLLQLSDDDLPSDISNYSSFASGQFSGEGYITANLSTPFNFSTNGRCAVIVKLTPDNIDSNVYIPYEDNYKRFGPNYPVSIYSEINEGESFLGTLDLNGNIVWEDCCLQNSNNITGNFIIRPVLRKSNNICDEINVFPCTIVDNGFDIDVSVSSMDTLFNIHTSTGQTLKQDIDYTRTSSGITINQSFISSLNGQYTQLILEFNNDTSQTIIITPKSEITNVQITGEPIIGETLSVQLTGQPALTSYDVNYQWEYSSTGIENTWLPITGATQSSYIIDDTYFNDFLRVTVTPQPNGNVITGNTSNSTEYQAVILGDCNFDGFIDTIDVTKIQKHLAGIIELNNRELLAADYNKDGLLML